MALVTQVLNTGRKCITSDVMLVESRKRCFVQEKFMSELKAFVNELHQAVVSWYLTSFSYKRQNKICIQVGRHECILGSPGVPRSDDSAAILIFLCEPGHPRMAWLYNILKVERWAEWGFFHDHSFTLKYYIHNSSALCFDMQPYWKYNQLIFERKKNGLKFKVELKLCTCTTDFYNKTKYLT